jgi:thymidylate synthase
MIYNRPSMHDESTKDGMHDFCCTYAVQCFLNPKPNNEYYLKYIVYMRSNDAVFGFNNDHYWHKTIQQTLVEDLRAEGEIECIASPIEWNAGSLHVYERHFNLLDE